MKKNTLRTLNALRQAAYLGVYDSRNARYNDIRAAKGGYEGRNAFTGEWAAIDLTGLRDHNGRSLI